MALTRRFPRCFIIEGYDAFIPAPRSELDAVMEQSDSTVVGESRGESFFGPGQSGSHQVITSVAEIGKFARMSSETVIGSPVRLAVDVLFGLQFVAPVITAD